MRPLNEFSNMVISKNRLLKDGEHLYIIRKHPCRSFVNSPYSFSIQPAQKSIWEMLDMMLIEIWSILVALKSYFTNFCESIQISGEHVFLIGLRNLGASWNW